MSPKTELLIKAVAAIKDELPDLLGEEWFTFHTYLFDYLTHLEQGTEDETLVRRWLLDLFEQHPAAHARLLAEQERLDAQEGLEVRWGNVRFTPLTSLLARLAPRTVTRYTDIACPRRVSRDSPRVTVTVRLTVRVPSASAAVAAMEVNEALTVRVRLEAPAFDMLGSAEAEIELRPDADSPPVVFDLRPRVVGETFLSFDFAQAGHPVGTVTVPIEVVATEVIEEQQSQPLPSLRFEVHPDVPPPDLTLVISYQLDPPALLFRLERAGGASQSFRPLFLKGGGSPSSYAAQCYADLKLLTSRRDPTHQEVLKQARLIPPEEVDGRLREIGNNLWRDLFPPDFHHLYATEREQWRDKSLLILSDEPSIPWELVWPYDTRHGEDGWGDDPDPWCLTLRLTRWMRHDEQGEGIPYGPRPTLPLQRLALVVPEDSDLPHALKERDALRALMVAHALHDASPRAATRREVLALLEGGGYDWLHVASHGNFAPGSLESDTALWLEGRETLAPSAIVGKKIEPRIRTERPAFVLNVCEVGRQGWGLTGIAGWANRLLRLDASLLVAPLWVVTDHLAAQFTPAFYAALLKGETVGDAVRRGRLAARQAGNPTWLAYSVYAHPNARLDPPRSTKG